MLLGKARCWAIVALILSFFFLGVLNTPRLRIFNKCALICVLAGKVILEYSRAGGGVLVSIITTSMYSPFFLFVC